jgi:hypothetical protein
MVVQEFTEGRMYLATILLLILIFPGLAVGLDLWAHPGAPLMLLIGKWFTFFAVGLRLFIAGIRQNLQPAFTATAIFGIEDPKALGLVSEIGFGNLAIGAAGLLSVALPGWLSAAAFTGGLYYGLAGLGHALKPDRSAKEQIALVSDLLIFVLLLVFVVIHRS